MDKQAFLAELRDRLFGLPKEGILERLSFYSEVIDDRVEDGLTEEQAVAQLGSVEDVTEQIMSEYSLPKLVKEAVKPKRMWQIWEIILLVLGSPIWLSILFAIVMLILSVYLVIWSGIVLLWTADLTAVCSLAGCLVSTCVYFAQGNPWAALALLGAGLACAGLSVLLFFGSIYAAKGVFLLTKKTLIRMKLAFIGKKVEQ